MKRVALMHSNADLAQCLSDAVNEWGDGWQAEPHVATSSETSVVEQVKRAKNVGLGDYDLIQVDELVGNGPFATLLSKITQTPVVGYLRGYGDYTNKHGLYSLGQRNKIRLKSRLCFALMDDIACISEAVKAGVSDMYPSHSCSVIERPYDVHEYMMGSSGLFERPTVLTVTNLRYREKAEGVLEVIRGFKNANERVAEDWQLVIAGEGQHSEMVNARTSGRSDVHLLGWRDDIPDLLGSAQIFAYLSYLDGRPSTVYEAKSAGLPIVAGDASGVPEAVGDSGYTVPPTYKGIEGGLVKLMQEPETRLNMANEALTDMVYHNERVTQDWIAFWEAQL